MVGASSDSLGFRLQSTARQLLPDNDADRRYINCEFFVVTPSSALYVPRGRTRLRRRLGVGGGQRRCQRVPPDRPKSLYTYCGRWISRNNINNNIVPTPIRNHMSAVLYSCSQVTHAHRRYPPHCSRQMFFFDRTHITLYA